MHALQAIGPFVTGYALVAGSIAGTVLAVVGIDMLMQRERGATARWWCCWLGICAASLGNGWLLARVVGSI